MDEGVRLISDAILGEDGRAIVIDGKVYMLYPPTVERIAGAGKYLNALPDGDSVLDILRSMSELTNACRALSWFIQGDESLTWALSQGTLEEVKDGLEIAISLIGIQNFLKLSGLARSVRSLIATSR